MLAIVLAQLFLNFISFIQSQFFIFLSTSSSSGMRNKTEVEKKKWKSLATTRTLKEIEGLLKKYEMETEVVVDSWLIYALEDLRDELKEELITGEAEREEEEDLLSFEERLEIIKEEWQVGEVFSSSSSSLSFCQKDGLSYDFGELVSPSSICHDSLGAPLLCST
jgi:hypothetical protein